MSAQPRTWRKSSFSVNSADCVEVATSDGEILVRNSKRIGDGSVSFTPSEMAAFIAGVKNGEFDDLA